jgi:hypothetical protein
MTFYFGGRRAKAVLPSKMPSLTPNSPFTDTERAQPHRRWGLSEFSEVVIIENVPYAQSLQPSYRRCTYVTHPKWPGSSVGRAQP